MDEKFDNDLNFSKILFLHINRTLMSTNGPFSFFYNNIETLEILLSPYIDDEYKKIEIVSKVLKHYYLLDQSFGDKNIMINQKRTELAIDKFRALMSLAERKGLLLEKKGEGHDTEDDDDGV